MSSREGWRCGVVLPYAFEIFLSILKTIETQIRETLPEFLLLNHYLTGRFCRSCRGNLPLDQPERQ
jgi:hypothetical protein